MSLAQTLDEVLRVHGLAATRAERAERVDELLTTVGLAPRLKAPPAACAERRPAPAHQHRARARGRPAGADRRRARLGAGCLDPGADHQPARGAARAAEDRVGLHLARPERRAPHQRSHRGDVSRPGRRDGPDRGAVRRPAIPTRGRCWRRSRNRSVAALGLPALAGELPDPGAARRLQLLDPLPLRRARVPRARPALLEQAPGHAVRCRRGPQRPHSRYRRFARRRKAVTFFDIHPRARNRPRPGGRGRAAGGRRAGLQATSR